MANTWFINFVDIAILCMAKHWRGEILVNVCLPKVNCLCSIYIQNISKAIFGKILANWLSLAKFANILPIQYFTMYSIHSWTLNSSKTTSYYAFEQCSKIKPIMLKIMLNGNAKFNRFQKVLGFLIFAYIVRYNTFYILSHNLMK